MTEMTKNEIEEVLLELEKYKGRHTELITVYIPAGYDVNSVQRQLEAEKSTAKNIKSTSTRKNVGDALDKIVRHLKTLKKTPKNGLALFSGNVSQTEGQDDLRLWEIEPHSPLKSRLYRCDKEFVLEPLREMLEVTEIYGLLVMDRKEAAIGMLEGKRIEVLQKMTSGIPSKVRAGGQCLSPDTLIMKDNGEIIEIKDIMTGEKIKALNIPSNKIVYTKCIKKWETKKDEIIEITTKNNKIITSLDHVFFLFIGNKLVEIPSNLIKKGAILINSNLSREKIINIKRIKKNLLLIDIETSNKNFFANNFLVHNSSQRFHRITEGLTKEFYKRIAEEMKKIFFENKKLKGILIGGPIPTKDEFLDGQYMATKLRDKVVGRIDIGGSDESGLKELVQKSQDILAGQEIVHEKKLLEKFFDHLGRKPDLAALKEEKTKRALKYGAVDTLILSKDVDKTLAKELKQMAESTSSSVEIVSSETEEGEQFKNLGGVGAILRFKI